ncbi:fd3ee73f-1640-46dc-9f86-d94d6024a6ad-CDS [Sclerotinia trifoliorum]|uniref:Protein-S-isoprenylcysteine O-methyltransferase n=1 Tax=Sclerotinia trifoliorum TaxID=28548 RepID=A0A8H2VVM9_9HELO|nr:fd3ee73f-1640-46dc-9f86-d94d6024a6ad-CDS [Sclerotinia trifoliorum]
MSTDSTANAIGSASAQSSAEQSKSTASTSSATHRRPWDIIQNGGVAPRARVGPDREQYAEIPSISEAINQFEKQFHSGQPKSLSGIALRSFLVGIVLTFSTFSTLYLFFVADTIFWRIPFFISCLSIFHFLEFWTTARYNTPEASISSFLFSGNGSAYNIAHTAAITEFLITNTFFPNGSPYVIYGLQLPPSISWFSPRAQNFILVLGLILILMGQTIRSVAMVQAGRSFNHIVQFTRSRSHTLVTTGLYAWLRHPSYFGFFWWGLGTQMVLGNFYCFCGYTLVLWMFFNRRIKGEEALLIKFFGDEYVQYRKISRVGIPFI